MTEISEGGLPLQRRRQPRGLAVQLEREFAQYVSSDANGGVRRPDMTLGRTLRQLWRRRALITAATLFGLGVAAFTSWLIPPLYLAEARVIVGLQGPKVLNIDPTLADLNPD